MPPDLSPRKRRIARIICGYPIALALIATAVNLFAIGIAPAKPAVPDSTTLIALAISAALLLVNHVWLMTATELTRLRHGIATTPEELGEDSVLARDGDPTARDALERRLNAHRNLTENTVYFALLAPLFALVSPPALASYLWITGFAAARLGHSAAYLTRQTGLRGLFMSLSLTALFGMASYLLLTLTA